MATIDILYDYDNAVPECIELFNKTMPSNIIVGSYRNLVFSKRIIGSSVALCFICENAESLVGLEEFLKEVELPEKTVLIGCDCDECIGIMTSFAERTGIRFFPDMASFQTEIKPFFLSEEESGAHE